MSSLVSSCHLFPLGSNQRMKPSPSRVQNTNSAPPCISMTQRNTAPPKLTNIVRSKRGTRHLVQCQRAFLCSCDQMLKSLSNIDHGHLIGIAQHRYLQSLRRVGGNTNMIGEFLDN